MEQEKTCPHCGTSNRAGRALCAQCNFPLTAYAGDLTGESYQGKLAGQVALLEQRPPVIPIVAVGLVLLAIVGPLLTAARAFQTQPKVNEEGTNYVAASFGSVGPIMQAFVLVPVALLFLVVAWGIWTQRPWGWPAGLVTLGLLAVRSVLSITALPSLLLLIACGVLAWFWLRPTTKAWFGQNT